MHRAGGMKLSSVMDLWPGPTATTDLQGLVSSTA
jgi:hypothetical protein